jgi:hypothetical protein
MIDCLDTVPMEGVASEASLTWSTVCGLGPPLFPLEDKTCRCFRIVYIQFSEVTPLMIYDVFIANAVSLYIEVCLRI